MIFTSAEDYTIDLMEKRFKEVFPDYDVVIDYQSTSDIATKVILEGASSGCDIVFAEEFGYVAKMAAAGVLTDISSMYDTSIFTDETQTEATKKFTLPSVKTGGGVVVNTKVLSDNGIAEPTSYNDLLDAKYKNLISMASPKSSGTGYMFYLSLVNAWGEANALTYFNGFTANVIQYTKSGSGPVNALVSREAAVGFGMISQAVEKINGGNQELKILFFEEGAPFNLYGTSIVKGKESKKAVKDVMDYFYNGFIDEIDGLYYPEPVIKNKAYEVANYPKNVKYADMHDNTLATKEHLLDVWTH